jgi:2-polyprenyl-3-methyl-5-hydroxy-6-metoxy-1,4-benzoquinol methylase
MSDYSTIYKNDDGKSMLQWREKDADPYLNLLRNSNQLLFLHTYKPLKQPLTIFEYGCAFADLISMVKHMNPEHEVYAVEKVKEVARVAEARLGKGRVFNQSLERPVPLKPNSIDLVFSFDVIEHVRPSQVRGMLKECNRLLKQDGLCIFATPNFNWMMKLVYRITGNKYLVDRGFHPNQYTFSRLEKEVGRELKVIGTKKGYGLSLALKLLSILGVHKHCCIIAGKKL